MRKFAIALTIPCCLFLIPRVCAGKAWRGITPLISTRRDVERILGKPVLEKNVYDTEDGRAIVYYSDGQPCEEGLPGLGNIPRDTVVEISLNLAKQPNIAEVLVAGKEYVQTRANHTPHVYYADEAEGVRYTTEYGVVWSISYFGSLADAATFSCGELKYAAPVPRNPDPVRVEQYPFDSFGRIRLEDAHARLDNFVIQLNNLNEARPEYRGFIIIYGGKSSYAREPESVAECYRDYLVKYRHAEPETIVAVAGGHQEEFRVELYLMPTNSYPPVLMPTVGPKKVQIKKGRFKACS